MTRVSETAARFNCEKVCPPHCAMQALSTHRGAERVPTVDKVPSVG